MSSSSPPPPPPLASPPSHVAVIDFGSTSVRAGYAGDDRPRIVESTAVRRRGAPSDKDGDVTMASRRQDCQWPVDLNALSVLEHNAIPEYMPRSVLSYDSTSQTLGIGDEDNLKLMLESVLFSGRPGLELCLNGGNALQSVLISSHEFLSERARERLLELMMEDVLHDKASEAGVLIAKRPPLALFANGRTSGIYVGIGGEFVSTSVVSSGYTVPCTVRHDNKGGRTMDQYIAAQILFESAKKPSDDLRMAGRLFDLGRRMGLSTLPSVSDHHMLTGPELALCSMAEMTKIQSCLAREERSPLQGALPDGTVVPGAWKSGAIEQIIGGLPSMVEQSFAAFSKSAEPASAINAVSQSVVLSGQASQTPGLVERLQKDFAMCLRDGKVRVMGGAGFPTVASGGERGYCPWLGGSIVGSMGSSISSNSVHHHIGPFFYRRFQLAGDKPERAHHTISTNFAKCPATLAVIELPYRTTKSQIEFVILSDDGTVKTQEKGNAWGTWWPHSAKCLVLKQNKKPLVFIHQSKSVWMTPCRTTAAILKPGEDAAPVGSDFALLKAAVAQKKGPSLAMMRSPSSRSRRAIVELPASSLDRKHSDLLKAMGLRVVDHPDCGRVLVASRAFEEGECVVFSRVTRYSVESTSEIDKLRKRGHPEHCFLTMIHESRGGMSVYYNRDTFDMADPVGGGDLWYLVNHSTTPNAQLRAHDDGLCVKAVRDISPGEPITWRYPIGFFSEEDVMVSLPRAVNVIDDPKTYGG
ncbi:Spindle pole body component alp6 [Perkinsus chesapeaki]|uniref:Spindle pole body component alp6 n=1 Tax=Perkinsus chesapeaki TaxID=330153 RepID=A0A7J6MVU3_PERCH|nr:Spindle pole body component alp6 [Perkinsus chesapeaki]